MNDETTPADNNPDFPSLTESEPAPAPQPPAPNPRPLVYWLKKLLVCNPFFLASAALLLYGMYRISVDANFLPTETGQLTFNFSSLQIYELALVATAAVLARRRIWYDSTLLVVLENMFILVPFILVSQAALIESKTVATLCVVAAGIAAVRTDALRRHVSELWPTHRLFGIGALVLSVNCALPIVYRHFHESKFGTKLEIGPAYEMNLRAWLFILPAVCALANLLPKPVNDDHPLTQRRWFPHALLAFWILGTGTHLFCLGYVYDFDLNRALLAPALWVLAWTVYLKLPDFVTTRLAVWRGAALILPLLMALLSAGVIGSHVFAALTVLNAAAFAFIAFREPGNKLALHLGMFSLAAFVAGLPVDWMMPKFAGFDRVKLAGTAATAYMLLAAALSRNPKLGLLGVFAAATAGALASPQVNTMHWAVQAGLVFFLLHSLRWNDHHHEGASLGRWVVSVAWVAHSAIWVRDGAVFLNPVVIGAIVLAVCCVSRFIKLNWSPLAVPVAAVLVALCSPVNFACVKLQTTPAGVIAIVASFTLFAVGTIAALTKHRWHHNGTEAGQPGAAIAKPK